MEPLPPDRRRYGDKEITKILRRAADLQRATPARPDPSGLTLAELEEIAAEAGIDPENVRRAALAVVQPDRSSWETRLLGAPLVFRLQEVLPGEMPVEAFGTLIPLLQGGTGMTGQAATVGKTLTWASSAGGDAHRSLHIMVAVERGETLVQLEERSGQVALGFHGGFSAGGLGIALPAGIGLGAAAGVAAGLGGGVALGGFFYLLGRSFYKLTTDRRRRRLETLFAELVARVRASIEATGS